MEIITEPIAEEQILITTSPEATAEEIAASLVARAECCVDHLCGCKASEAPLQATIASLRRAVVVRSSDS